MTKDQGKPDDKSTLGAVLQSIWAPITAVVGVVMLVMQLIQLWRGDQATVTYVIAVIAAILILSGLIWVGFSKRPLTKSELSHHRKYKSNFIVRYPRLFWLARIGLVIFLVAGGVSGYLIYRHQQDLKDKVIILIAIMDGPEDKYGITNQLIEQLNNSVDDYDDTLIVALGEKISVSMGSEYARKVGYRYLADIVIWGWYRPTENPNVTLHVENLTSNTEILLSGSSDVKPEVRIADLESFTLQQKLGSEMSSVVLWVSGLAHDDAGDYPGALERYQEALTYPWPENAISQTDAYYLIGTAYYLLGQYDQAISEYNQSLQFDPNNYRVYDNRGLAYFHVGQRELSLKDFDKSLEINLNNDVPYIGQGNLYLAEGEFNLAIENYTQAIQINPGNSSAFSNRSIAYAQLKQYNQSLDDANAAIRLDPKSFASYTNRGLIYLNMGQYNKAMIDFARSIRIDPQSAVAYSNRGNGYYYLKEYSKAISDYTKAIELDPNFDQAFFSRGLVYEKLGQTDKAILDFRKCLELTTDPNLKSNTEAKLQQLAEP